MKLKLLYAALVAITLFACSKSESDSITNATVTSQLLGKWVVEKEIEDIYRPLTTLISSDETAGIAGDSLVFKADQKVYVYSDSNNDEVLTYHLTNNNTIKFENVEWKITRLTTSEFHLFSDEINIQANEKSIMRVYLKRG